MHEKTDASFFDVLLRSSIALLLFNFDEIIINDKIYQSTLYLHVVIKHSTYPSSSKINVIVLF